MDDETLLQQVTKPYLQSLCQSLHLSQTGTKKVLLQRLRSHAEEKALKEREKKRFWKRRMDLGLDVDDDGKTKHRIVTDEDGKKEMGEWGMEIEEELIENGIFYFELPKNETEMKSDKKKENVVNNEVETARKEEKLPQNLRINAKGQRVEEGYSTKVNNDLTGVAAANPMSSSTMMGNTNDMMTGSKASSASSLFGTNSAEEYGENEHNTAKKPKLSDEELEEAKDALFDLVQGLLSMTGLPKFQDELVPLEEQDDGTQQEHKTIRTSNSKVRQTLQNNNSNNTPQQKLGFDPQSVPISLLTDTTRYIRLQNGQILHEIIQEFEYNAITYDSSPDTKKDPSIQSCGGYYTQVRKIYTFLEGYRKAEVRRVSRGTVSMLLDVLVKDGVRGLDVVLTGMTRRDGGMEGDGGGVVEVGELDDSLVEYLNDAVRQQVLKVEEMERLGNKKDYVIKEEEQDLDGIKALWKADKDESGQVIETIDLKDPAVQKRLNAELVKMSKESDEVPKNPTLAIAEQILRILTLLRDRIKAEAAFTTDEKGRNLRVLAHVLHARDMYEGERMILNQLGSSLDRLDSFLELVENALDYADQVSHGEDGREQPASLNTNQLTKIRDMVLDLKEKQAWKASSPGSSSVGGVDFNGLHP